MPRNNTHRTHRAFLAPQGAAFDLALEQAQATPGWEPMLAMVDMDQAVLIFAFKMLHGMTKKQAVSVVYGDQWVRSHSMGSVSQAAERLFVLAEPIFREALAQAGMTDYYLATRLKGIIDDPKQPGQTRLDAIALAAKLTGAFTQSTSIKETTYVNGVEEKTVIREELIRSIDQATRGMLHIPFEEPEQEPETIDTTALPLLSIPMEA